MPVRETLDFSGRCLGVGTRHDLLVELTRQEKRAGIQPDPVIDAFMKATSMEHQETSLITDYALKVFLSVISILLRSSDRSISLPIRCYSWKNRSGGKYTWYLYNATCFLTWRVHYRQRSNSVSLEDQPRVEKLSLKKKAIGSEARAERMANAERGRR